MASASCGVPIYSAAIGGTATSDSMVQPQMDRSQFRDVSNLDLVEPNQIRDSTDACIRLLFDNFFDVENVAYMHLPFNDIRHSPHASRNGNCT